jgi:glycosyltransferase involved in cell wall biosynthesis
MEELKKDKNIDVVVKNFYPVAAGIETNVMETYSVLAEQGWDVTIHTSKDVYLEKGILPDEEMIRGLKVRRYAFGTFGYFPDIDWNKTGLVCLHNFDIFPHLRILGYSLLRKILGRKKYGLILTPHGGFNPEWTIFSKTQAFIKKAYHYSLGVILINAVVDAARAVSKWEKKEMVAKGIKNDKISVIDNGLEDEAYLDIDRLASIEIKGQVKKYGRYIIQVGRIYMIKNNETVIRALPSLPADVKYVMVGPVGSKEYKTSLERMIREMGLEERVIFTGVVRGIDKYYLIKHSEMMVHMALWESYCNVIHEGLSQGLVCIAADNTALPFLIKDKVNGYLVGTKDFKTLAEKINYVLENKDSRIIKDIENRNRESGLKNSWREVAGRMDILYRNVISKYGNIE